MRANQHLGTEQLLDFLDGRLAASEAAAVQAHLQTGCSRCIAQRDYWQRTLSSVKAAESDTPPEWALRRAVAAFANFTPQPSGWRQFLATLVFDSRLQAAPSGIRDTGAASFQLLFRAELPDAVEVDLLCEREGAAWTITGQAVGGDVAGAACSGPGGAWEEAVEPGGEFRFREVPPGAYELALRGADSEIRLTEIRLGPDAGLDGDGD